jgi:hypothetical protein
MKTTTKSVIAAAACVLAVAGCAAARSAVSGAIGGASGAAGARVGASIGSRVRGPSVPGMPAGAQGAQMMGFYANYMFGMAFHSGGYWVGGAGAGATEQPGQWTMWEYDANGGAKNRMERAFLTRLPDGKEWWRVRWYNMEGSNPDTVVFEAMFSADRSQVLRMRGKTSGQEAGEIPVEQGTTGFTYTSPTVLTQESLQGATVGNEAVTTPAGTFQTTHIRYTMMGGGSYEWWTAGNVPGGVVRYTTGYQSDRYTVTLVGMGSDARSILGSYQ